MDRMAFAAACIVMMLAIACICVALAVIP